MFWLGQPLKFAIQDENTHGTGRRLEVVLVWDFCASSLFLPRWTGSMSHCHTPGSSAPGCKPSCLTLHRRLPVRCTDEDQNRAPTCHSLQGPPGPPYHQLGSGSTWAKGMCLSPSGPIAYGSHLWEGHGQGRVQSAFCRVSCHVFIAVGQAVGLMSENTGCAM